MTNVIDFQKEKLAYDFAAWVALRGTMVHAFNKATVDGWCVHNAADATQEQRDYIQEHYRDYLIPLEEPELITHSL